MSDSSRTPVDNPVDNLWTKRDLARAYQHLARSKRLIEDASGSGTPRQGGLYG